MFLGAEVPTAHAPAFEAATPVRNVLAARPPGSGLGTTLHFFPFQCSISGITPPVKSRRPTDHTDVGENAATPASAPLTFLPPIVAAAATRQADPFQCSISGLPCSSPTAPALLMDSALTPARTPPDLPPTAGFGVMCHLPRDQCSMRGTCSLVPTK